MADTQAAVDTSAPKAAPKQPAMKIVRGDLIATIRDKGGNELFDNYIIFDHPETDEALRKASAEDIKKYKIVEGDEILLYDPETDQQVRGTIEKRPDGKSGLAARVYWATLCNVCVNITKDDINKDLNNKDTK